MTHNRWHPPEDGAAQLAVAHFKAGGPVYDDALSRRSDAQGPLLLMLPTDIAAALRQCNRCIVVDLSCNCEACSLDAPGVVTPDTAPDISEPT